jgi:hypothetical protein
METFMTHFNMAGVRTNVTIQVLEENKFGFVLHFSDPYEGDDLVAGEKDGTIIRNGNGNWELAGGSRITLSEDDVKNLGAAIDKDYLNA